MKLYLVQHGDAVAKEVNPERPLSDQGRIDVENVTRFLARAGINVPVILHGGKRRTAQTAELLAGGVGQSASPDKVSGIDPLDPVAPFAQTVAEWTSDTMVVGHLPFLGKLVSLLVTGDETPSVVAFGPASVACLERGQGDRWTLDWMIRPELVTGEDRDRK